MAAAIDTIGEFELLAIPTLFTRWRGTPEFGPLDFATIAAGGWDDSFRPFVESVVAPRAGNPAVLAWDLCNEPPVNAAMLEKQREGAWDAEVVRERQFEWLGWVRDVVLEADPAGTAEARPARVKGTRRRRDGNRPPCL